jgi:NADP-dependent 3-hydroxy acid dehydrogenase YdfG
LVDTNFHGVVNVTRAALPDHAKAKKAAASCRYRR